MTSFAGTHRWSRGARSTGVVALALVFALPSSARAQDVFVATSVSPRFDDGSHIGPDAYDLRYEWAGRWRAAVGGELVLVGVADEPGALALTLAGRLALDNEDDFAPVPYQLLRAVLALNVRAATPWRALDDDHRLRIGASLGFAHESDHPSGTSNVEASLSPFVSLDDFSSFEYVRLLLQLEHRYRELTWLSFGAGLRVYTPPINPLAGREQRVAFELEARGRWHVHEVVAVYAAVYVEGIGHELNPARVGRPELPALFSLVRAELGLSFATEDIGRLDVYVGVLAGHGRGLDFVNDYEPAFLAGLRGTL